MADGGGAKCSAAVGEGAYFMAIIMATVLVLSGLFQSALRRLGQPSIISHILVYMCYACMHTCRPVVGHAYIF